MSEHLKTLLHTPWPHSALETAASPKKAAKPQAKAGAKAKPADTCLKGKQSVPNNPKSGGASSSGASTAPPPDQRSMTQGFLSFLNGVANSKKDAKRKEAAMDVLEMYRTLQDPAAKRRLVQEQRPPLTLERKFRIPTVSRVWAPSPRFCDPRPTPRPIEVSCPSLLSSMIFH